MTWCTRGLQRGCGYGVCEGSQHEPHNEMGIRGREGRDDNVMNRGFTMAKLQAENSQITVADLNLKWSQLTQIL